ncbi:methylaspartate mutase accessory protein GlmL [Succinispira mobilis]|uniref:methylaspartate mutase accessory protein GlmL n=1 Tax=Succinispira mobilis TaxID=78120 RepID=UPI00036F70F8|nr:methylaspartate mutase accessory protein GlmL [Succinispira mobilis]
MSNLNNVLLIDFGSTYTKITAVDMQERCLLGTATGYTTVSTDIMQGLNQALHDLENNIGKVEFDQVLGCSSAAGGLKMVAIGLIEELTAEAAKRAALGAGAKVLGVFCGELSSLEVKKIAELQPDIILLAGGTDGGNKAVILHNAQLLTKLTADIPFVVAGNKSVVDQVAEILAVNKSEVIISENVMPKVNVLNINPAREAIRSIFLKRIIHAKGIDKANVFVNKLLMPTPEAVLVAAELLSAGTNEQAGIGELLLVDIGGATTDVYSMAVGNPTGSNVVMRGLPEPYAKRTVEGDLGMRYSAQAVVDAVGLEKIANSAKVSIAELQNYIEYISKEIHVLPKTAAEKRMEIALAFACTREAVNRHVGQLEQVFMLTGKGYVQVGKDLSKIQTVIGTGGVLLKNSEPKEILKGALYTEQESMLLKPQHAKLLLDNEYILASMGLLAQLDKNIALEIMKNTIVK